jgi:serine/threonine protein kinase
MLVTDLIPGTSLMARVSESPPLDTRSILLIAVNALEAVRKFHNSGFAHGDIHWGNIMVHGTSARLIDLGRANPFANEDGSHMPIQQKPDRLAPADDTLNIGFLSPWHIESNLGSKYLSSRRDDVFRLAEMFCRVSSDAFRSDILLRTMVANLLGFGLSDFKRQVAGRPTWHEIPRPAMAFYTYTLTLGFDEEPDYARWIAEFKK